MKVEELIKEKKATIVDVRTPGEFMGGNVAGSINIPLQELNSRMDEIKKILNTKYKLFPATFWVAPQDKIKIAIGNIRQELKEQLIKLKKITYFLI